MEQNHFSFILETSHEYFIKFDTEVSEKSFV
jgi:hypothetical protein